MISGARDGDDDSDDGDDDDDSDDGDDDDDSDDGDDEDTDEPEEVRTWVTKTETKLKNKTSGWLSMSEAQEACEADNSCAGISCKSKKKCCTNGKSKGKTNSKFT